MSQPPAYNRAYSFQSYQSLNPSLPLPADQVDLEYNRLKATLDAVLANLALIQRDDGALANASVGRDQLSPTIEIGFEVPTKWATARAYAVDDTVFHANIFYRCLVAHTSGTFATDLASSKWEEIADFSSLTQNASLIVYDNAVSLLAATDVQDAVDELALEKLDKAGGTMTGALSMGSNRITGVANAAAPGDAVNLGTADVRFQVKSDDLTAIAALTTTAYGRALLTLANGTALMALVPNDSIDLAMMQHANQGQLFYYTTDGAPARLGAGTSGKVLEAAGAGADPAWAWSQVVQTIYVRSAAATVITATIPLDNTLPLVSEGTQILTQAITLSQAGHKVLVEGNVQVGATTGTQAVIAVFRGSTCVAAVAASVGFAAPDEGTPLHFMTSDNPGTIGPHTYQVRIGTTGADIAINSFDGANRVFGGASEAVMKLQEVR